MNLNKDLKTIEQNHLGHFVYLPKNLGFEISECNSVTIINCGLQTSMFNIVYGAPTELITTLSLLQKTYDGKPFAWWIPPSGYNATTTKTLLENGFTIESVEHAMICNINNISSFSQKTNLLIRPVTSQSGLSDFLNILKPYDRYILSFYERMTDDLLQSQEKLIVGYANGQPVTIGVLFISGDSAGIFSLITAEAFQGQGYGTDMMLFLMKVAKEHGCHSVTLSASSDSGYRIYERLGFVKRGAFECFEYKGSKPQ